MGLLRMKHFFGGDNRGAEGESAPWRPRGDEDACSLGI